MRKLVGLLLIGVAAACTASHPLGTSMTIAKETPAECTAHCGSIGMRMSAVVIIASMTGCVCEPAVAKTAAAGGGAPAASGGAVAAILAAQQQQQQAASQSSQQKH